MSRIGKRKIEIPAGVTIEEANSVVTVKGPKGELSIELVKGITIKTEENTLEVFRENDTKQVRAMHGTTNANLTNMITGVTDGFEYHMKIVFAHFPMTVKVEKDIVTIDNFLGERHPRTAKIVGSAKVAVKGDEVTITGINKEHVGQTMANLEQATKIKGRDPRVFQDGIYLISKE